METKPLTIQIPEPDDEGLCSARCDLLQIDDDIYFKCKYGMVFEECLCKPGPGCPWHDGGKDE
jgi:hypothetical protein